MQHQITGQHTEPEQLLENIGARASIRDFRQIQFHQFQLGSQVGHEYIQHKQQHQRHAVALE